MTNEELQRLAAELDKHAQAGEIEMFVGEQWLRQKFSPNYRFLEGLRIKPHPREVWIHERDIGEALRSATTSHKPGENFRKFREVLE